MSSVKNIAPKRASSLRYCLLLPLALLCASVVASIISYSDARKTVADDLNRAMVSLANEYSEVWTRQDTIAALRTMYAATRKPIIYRASELNLRNIALKDEVYFTLALTDRKNTPQEIQGHIIKSDSIMLVPAKSAEGIAIQVQGFTDCSMASLFAASDQTLPGALFGLAILSAVGMLIWRSRKSELTPDVEMPASEIFGQIKLTPMQRRLALMLYDAPGRKVDKNILCDSLWGNKLNAEESLYTLVKRTKAALVDTDMEIICNRGESYELRVKA